MAPFTADEAWSYHKAGRDLSDDALALQNWPVLQKEWSVGNEISDAQAILDFKELMINESLETLRSRKEIGQSLEAEIEIKFPPNHSLLPQFLARKDDLAEIFIVSNVSITEVADNEELQVIARHATGHRCPRSWRWVPELVSVEPWGEVSPRCAEVLAKLA
jgi:isoleucyl-tRNA synthetase